MGDVLDAIRQQLLPGREEARMLERQDEFFSRFAEGNVARFAVEIVAFDRRASYFTSSVNGITRRAASLNVSGGRSVSSGETENTVQSP